MTATDRTGPSINKGRSKQDYGTPWPFIRAVEAKWGPLIHDLACTRENAKAPSGYYFPEDDAFAHQWHVEFPHGNLWLNPPFADLAPWAAKCRTESLLRCRRRGFLFLLTPASVGAEWYAHHVHGSAYVLALRPRLTFEGSDDAYPKDLICSVYGYGLVGFDGWRWK